MQKLQQSAQFFQHHPRFKWTGAVLLVAIAFLLTADPASAHHAMGGKIPANFFEGFLSGLAHPIIGLDHFAFVVAIALLAALYPKGFFIPVAFAAAAMAGTGIHLLSLDLPAVELMISASVLGVGVMLALKENPQAIAIGSLAAIAGVFHGYAYGESIVGAQTTATIAYLLGFTAIQLAIAVGTMAIAKRAIVTVTENPRLPLRFAGFTICGIGAAFLATAIVG